MRGSRPNRKKTNLWIYLLQIHGELELLEEDHEPEEEETVFDRQRRTVNAMEIIEHPKIQKVWRIN